MVTDEAEHIDVLVAGAGPAGCSAAIAAAREGATVILADAKAEIGLPVRCAEYVPLLMAREVDIPEVAVAQRVGDMIVFVRGEPGCAEEPMELGRVRSPGFILHREHLEAGLAELAVASGARLLTGTRATPATAGEVDLVSAAGTVSVKPKVVVAADGPLSVFRPDMERTTCLPAVQHTVRLAGPMSCTEVHFARRFRFGYAWLFPKGDVANVGIACAPAGGRREMFPLLDAFVDDLRREGKLARGASVRRTAGWIPVWGPPESVVVVGKGSGSVLLAGDAGGFTDPVTGAGIWPAIATGRFAGECAARAALAGDPSLLSVCDERWRALFGAALARSQAARRKMENGWGSRDLAELVRDVWPGLGAGRDGRMDATCRRLREG